MSKTNLENHLETKMKNSKKGLTEQKIRFAIPHDVPAMVQIIQSVFALSCPPDTKAETINHHLTNTLNAEKLTELINADEHYVFVAQINEEVVGLGIIERINAQQAEFSKLYVAQSYHGYGLGKSLANAMIKQAKEVGFEQLILYVYKHNQQAKKLYQKLGFEYVKDSQFHIGDEIHDDEQYVLKYPNNTRAC